MTLWKTFAAASAAALITMGAAHAETARPAPRMPIPGPFVAEPEVAKVFDAYRARGLEPINLHQTLAYAPKLLGPITELTDALRTGITLTPVQRELVILRTGVVSNGEYEVFHHSVIGKVSGLTDAQIADISDWKASSAYSPAERALLAYIDESVALGGVSDATFAEVSKHYSPRVIVEATLLSGGYVMVGELTRSLNVQLDEKLTPDKLKTFNLRGDPRAETQK